MTMNVKITPEKVKQSIKDLKKNKNYFGYATDPELEDDERQADWVWQRDVYGYDYTELWNLNTTIAKFILPRLKHFQIICNSDENAKMYKAIGKMIDTFNYYAKDSHEVLSDKEYKKVCKGLKLFAKYFPAFWF